MCAIFLFFFFFFNDTATTEIYTLSLHDALPIYEAAFVLQDNVATAEQIDSIFKKCFGHKMGPLETADLIGLDTVMRSLDVLYESFRDPKYRCCPLLRKLVHAGHLGRKTGRGFHAYPGLE